MKKVISLILCCVMLVAVLAFSGCDSKKTGVSGSAEDALDTYIKAQDDLDCDAIIDLLPPDFYDFVYADSKDRVREEPTDEVIRNHVEMRYRPIVLTFDMAEPELRDADLKNDFSFSYKIEDTYKATSSELDEFNNYVKENLGFENKAQEVVLIEYRYTLKFKDKIYRNNEDIKNYGICVKMDGRWYYGDSHGFSSYMWEDREGLRINSCVQWIVDWFGR